jgi:hypothetical protein
MASAYNIDEIIAWLIDFLDSFNFNLPGVDRNLGRDLAHVFAGQIESRAATESRGADPQEWEPNEPGYAKRKEAAYGWPDKKPNYRTGQMLSRASVFGRTRVVDDKVVELVYGTAKPPKATHSPEDNRTPSEVQSDESITDVEKAEYASWKRPFFEVDDVVEEAVIDAADQALDQYILKFG